MNNRLDFGKQMDNSKNKNEIADIVYANKCKNVLDLGAGTCKISKQIADKGIKVTAVDFHLDDYDIERSELVTYVDANLIDYIEVTDEKFDCVILSGILHELSTDEYNKLKETLGLVLTEKALIVIREPIYDYSDIWICHPFCDNEAKDKLLNRKMDFKFKMFYNRFKRTKKLHEVFDMDKALLKLNAIFTYTYGKESWKRELKEYRFAYSKEEINEFLKTILGEDFKLKYINYFDESYSKYFNNCGLKDILDTIAYTNSMVIAKRN